MFQTKNGFLAQPDLQQLKRTDPVVVWTEPAVSTLNTQLGRSLIAERVQLLPLPAKR